MRPLSFRRSVLPIAILAWLGVAALGPAQPTTPSQPLETVDEVFAEPTATPSPEPTASPTPTPHTTPAVRDLGEPLARKDYALEFEAAIDPERDLYPINKNFDYVVRVSWNGDPEEGEVAFPENLPLSNLDLKNREVGEVAAQDGRSMVRCTYTLSPVEVGAARIGAVDFAVTLGSSPGGERRGERQGLFTRQAEVELDAVELDAGPPVRAWGRILLGIAGLLVLLILLWWVLSVLRALARRRQYQHSAVEDKLSLDERLKCELATMHVSLLRAGIGPYYDKVFDLMRRLLRTKRLIDQEKGIDEIVDRLRREGVDTAYLDLVESIGRRCELVAEGREQPDESAHKKIAKDLRILLSMRSHGTRTPSRVESASDDSEEAQGS